MEPEIAFLIANLARVGFGTRVLDPFSGCGTLLMAAAHLQNMKPSATYMNAICELSDDSNIDDSTANHTKIATHGPQGETVVKDNFLLGVDANMGDISRIHDNFRAVQQSESIASLSLRWDLAESLLEVLYFISSFDDAPSTCNASASHLLSKISLIYFLLYSRITNLATLTPAHTAAQMHLPVSRAFSMRLLRTHRTKWPRWYVLSDQAPWAVSERQQ